MDFNYLIYKINLKGLEMYIELNIGYLFTKWVGILLIIEKQGKRYYL